MQTVLVVGSANLDHVYKVSNLPLAGQTLLADHYQLFAGGKGINQAAACSRLGGRVSFCACLGSDGAADFLHETLKESGVNADHVSRSSSPTGNASVVVSSQGTNQIVVASGSNADLSVSAVEAALREVQPDYVLTQLEVPIPCVEAASLGAKFILNPAPAAPISDDLISRCFAITPNETEAQALTGILPEDESSCEACAKVLLQKGAKNVVLTLGAKGSYWLSDEGGVFVETPKVNAVDTTAAGDVFNGAFVASLSRGLAFWEALNFASRAAAMSTTKLGAIASIPWLKEME